jgi:predicted nucleic acid-binding protein
MKRMSEPDVFFDTNVLLYLLSSDLDKAQRAEKIVEHGGIISIQVLNELTNVTHRKLRMPWSEINEVVSLLKSICIIKPLTLEVHEKGRYFAERYQLNVYDAMIVAAAFVCGCTILYSEDMHSGLNVEDKLRILNPFSS